MCQLVALLDLAASTVSKHMTVLRQARLVDFRKDGRWAYYRRTGREAPKAAQSALRWLDTSLAGDSDAARDVARLSRILETPVEVLCRTEPSR